MLSLYLACLAFGGIFLGASVLMGGGGHGDHDAGGGGHGDHDAGGGHDHDAAHGAAGGHGHGHAHGQESGGGGPWLAFLSLRFWTFALATFGLTGTLLTLGGFLPSAALVAGVSGTVGVGTGFAVATAFNRLRSYAPSSSVELRDYVGQSGKVLLPVAKGQLGKVRVEIRDRTIDLPAVTDDAEGDFARGDEVLVLGIKGNHAVVTTVPERKRDPGTGA